jgi:hypothetical protein
MIVGTKCMQQLVADEITARTKATREAASMTLTHTLWACTDGQVVEWDGR